MVAQTGWARLSLCIILACDATVRGRKKLLTQPSVTAFGTESIFPGALPCLRRQCPDVLPHTGAGFATLLRMPLFSCTGCQIRLTFQGRFC